LSKEEFAAQAAHFLADLNAIHPFRDGNGRAQLTFLALLAEQAGHSLNHDRLDPKRVMDAMIVSFGGEEAPLKDILTDLIYD
jgi:cell filamentation protein